MELCRRRCAPLSLTPAVTKPHVITPSIATCVPAIAVTKATDIGLELNVQTLTNALKNSTSVMTLPAVLAPSEATLANDVQATVATDGNASTSTNVSTTSSPSEDVTMSKVPLKYPPICSNIDGQDDGFTCACKDGFNGDGFSCQDVNECGGFTCTCHVGQ